MEQEFLDWFEQNQVRFHQGQFDDKDIAYSAWLEGKSKSTMTVNDIVEIVNNFAEKDISKGQIIDELKMNYHKYKFF